MKSQKFKEILKEIEKYPAYHLEAFHSNGGDNNKDKKYIVWQETGWKAYYGSDGRKAVVVFIQVELYTEDDFDPLLDELIALLEKHNISFLEPVTTFDISTKKILHIIECEVI